MPNLDMALKTIRDRASTTVFQGRSFERLVKAALLNHPGEFRDRFSKVWLWAEYPDRDGPDIGVDLVAEEHDGKRWAVQCKDYPNSKVTTAGINSFLAASMGFDGRLFVSTSKGPLPKAGWQKLQKAPNCRVLTHGDLDAWPVDWAEFVDEPDALEFTEAIYEARPYQQDAVDAIAEGLEEHRRGKLILPCGTGKSVVALWAAERLVGVGGRVLYVVPSISLLGQTMREWATQRRIRHRYIGVCSDSTAGKAGPEDANLSELSIPVTTDSEAVADALGQDGSQEMTVVFCTYQSLGVIAEAQDTETTPFGLMICDEAHRTTGVEKKGKKAVSAWLMAHDDEEVLAALRLYMTATPRLYSANVREKAQKRQVAIYSMDDETTYGPLLYQMSFKKAVEDGYLSDYEVTIVAVSDGLYANLAQSFVVEHKETGVNVRDVVKLLGCWDALADPTSRGPGGRVTGLLNPDHMARRAIAFSNTIKTSTNLEKWWPNVVRHQAADVGREQDLGKTLLGLEVEHIDGGTRASARAQALNQLRADIPRGRCRIITNAKCLTEGVDVPALDAVLFMQPRRSKVEIVQAVGRVMRSAPGKRRGYIVLPVIVPEGKRVTDSDFLRGSEFQPVWDVISALRAHDERMDVWVNTADIGGRPPVSLLTITGGGGEDNGDSIGTIQRIGQMSLPLNDEIASALVERCGDKRYWASWGDDVGAVTNRIRQRIESLLNDSDRQDTLEAFDRFHEELRNTINEHLSRPMVVGMLASHLVTLPVFEALFGSDQFARRNPVVRALDGMVEVLDREGLVNEARDLDHFYRSVKTRVHEVTDPDGRLRILLDLYESFFHRVEPKLASQAGIAFTPVEIVDFILRSADAVSRREFGRGLTDEGVHILDPFFGTGTFPYRLLTLPDLITDQDLARKYESELHANEWIPLSYYIGALKIEQGYMTRRPDYDYQPFRGIVLTDTFELNPQQPPMPTMAANSERARKQAKLPIQVIVGNPPWSAGQQHAGGDNPNIPHPDLEDRIRHTYAARSKAQNRNALMDLYKMAIRWATDRIGGRGIVAFVTPNGFLDGNAESGMRACLADEYTTIHIFNLRGNTRLQGEAWRREGGKVFGAKSRVGVAVTVMVRNPDTQHPGCRIHYRDIGDYLTREEKLQTLVDLGSIDGTSDWHTIEPDEHHDWINQRDPTWKTLVRLGQKDARANNPDAPGTVIRLYSRGVATSRDPYLYAFDNQSLAYRAEEMIDYYEQCRRAFKAGHLSLQRATTNDALHRIKWTSDLGRRLRRGTRIVFDYQNLRVVHHRPFTKQWLYYEPACIDRVYRIPAIFPAKKVTGESVADLRNLPQTDVVCSTLPNQAIHVTGPGTDRVFSALITDTTPDLHLLHGGQSFPRYRYETGTGTDPGLLDFGDPAIGNQDKPGSDGRVDNITDWCLDHFQQHYNDPSITKDGIWAHIYGVLHAPDWRTRYAHDLRKALPRIPLAADFEVFREAGQALMDLHLGYETCEPWSLTVNEPDDPGDDSFYRLDGRMRWGRVRGDDEILVDDRSILHVNNRCSIEGIPDEAHLYQVNGKTPLEWAIDRLRVSTDKPSGITNDPNHWHQWSDQPYNLILHLRRLVRVSVETHRIVSGLPPALTPDS
ncbi:MAG: DEAD/DEAH box helicase family protein [bacterium]|nr:DEAD/DEAH box helicase family protein [bacterium]